MKKLKLTLVRSTVYPDLLSIRLRDHEDDLTATDVRIALAEKFSEGDHVVLVLDEED